MIVLVNVASFTRVLGLNSNYMGATTLFVGFPRRVHILLVKVVFMGGHDDVQLIHRRRRRLSRCPSGTVRQEQLGLI